MTKGASAAVLAVALFCVSTSGPFLVMTGMDAWVVVFWRLSLSSALFLVWAAARGELRVAAGEGGRLVAGALLLAVHFALWVKAFDLTDYASNLVLLVTQPMFAALLAVRMGERRWRDVALSLLLALVGLVIIAGGDFALGPRALLGDLFCVLASVAIALFYVVTRQARAGTPLPTFMGITFAIGAVSMLPLAAIAGASLFDYPPKSWAWLSALVLVTTLAGHGLMNLAARHVALYTLNLVIVLEPAIAIAIGAFLFEANLKPATVAGGLLLCAAIVVEVLPNIRAGGARR